MKVQINAGALVAAADRYIVKIDARYAELYKAEIDKLQQPKYIKFLFWVFTIKGLTYEQAVARADHWNRSWNADTTLKRAHTFKAIAKHKNPNTILEITDPELEGIAPYLSEFSDPTGRIE